jgi:hypothetical protein
MQGSQWPLGPAYFRPSPTRWQRQSYKESEGLGQKETATEADTETDTETEIETETQWHAAWQSDR